MSIIPPKTSSRGGSPLPLTVQNLPATINPTNPSRNTINQRMGPNKAKIASVTRVGSRKQIISWMDAPDDLFFYRTEGSK